MEVTYVSGGGGRDEIIVGDNIVNFVDEGFWIMLVDTPVHMVKEHFIDGWGQEWFESDYVLQGL